PHNSLNPLTSNAPSVVMTNGDYPVIVPISRKKGVSITEFARAPEFCARYGTNLIRDLIPHELGGKVDLVFAAEGVCCRIEVPLEEGRPPVGAWKVSQAAAGWA